MQLADLVTPASTVVLTQECQKGVIGDLSLLPAFTESARETGMIANVGRIVSAGRAAGCGVIHCLAATRPDRRGSSMNARCSPAARGAGDLDARQRSVELVDGIDAAETDLFSTRIAGPSPVNGTEVPLLLRNLGAKTVVIAGVSTNVAIPNAAFDCVNAGYNVVIARDAITGFRTDYTDVIVKKHAVAGRQDLHHRRARRDLVGRTGLSSARTSFPPRKTFVVDRHPLQNRGPVTDLLVSSDSHVQVSHEAIKAHLASKHHDEYDRAVQGFMERMMGGAGAANQAWATKRQRKEKPNAKRFKNNSRAGYHDGAARLVDMDLDGVATEVVYSELSFFRYWGDLNGSQHDTTVAFNEVLREFAAPDPSRLVVSYQIPIQDIDGAMAEVKRVVGLGAKSLQLPVFPPELGLPDYYHERYDPLLALIEETGLPICCHIGLNTGLDDLVQRDPTPGSAIMVPMAMLSTGEALGMWIMTGVLERFPALKLVFVEPGVGWIAWWLNLVDDMVVRQDYELPDLRELPSFYFHRNVFITFIDEADALAYDPFRYKIGVENIMWSSDYPHPVSSFPNSRSVAAHCVAALPETERELITSGNAQRVWNL